MQIPGRLFLCAQHPPTWHGAIARVGANERCGDSAFTVDTRLLRSLGSAGCGSAMTAVKEAKPKPAAGRAGLRVVLRVPQAAWRFGRAHPRTGISAGFVLLAAIAPLLAVWVLRPPPPEPKPTTLAAALEELDKGHD